MKNKFGIFRNYSGMSMVELMIVVLIISIIVSIAIPNLARFTRKGYWDSEVRGFAKAVADASEAYMAQTGSYPRNLTSLTSATPPYLPAKYATYCTSGRISQWYTHCVFDDDDAIDRAYLVDAQDIQAWDNTHLDRLVIYAYTYSPGGGWSPKGKKGMFECYRGKILYDDSYNGFLDAASVNCSW